MSSKMFERSQVAELLGLHYAVIRNWSAGKPVTILPSVRAPGRKGSPNLYSIEDVYRMAVVQHLIVKGWGGGAIANSIMPGISNEILQPQARGIFLAAELEHQPKYFHITPKQLTDKDLLARVFWNFAKVRAFPDLIVDLERVLDPIDGRITEMEKEGKL